MNQFSFKAVFTLILAVIFTTDPNHFAFGQPTQDLYNRLRAAESNLSQLKRQVQVLDNEIGHIRRSLENNSTPYPSGNSNVTSEKYDRTTEERKLLQIQQKILKELQKNPIKLSKSFNLFGTTFHAFVIDLYKGKNLEVKFFWKDNQGRNYSSFKNILQKTPNNYLLLTNGGIFEDKYLPTPKGLFIEKGLEKNPIDINKNRDGNFYLQPNGIFLIKKDGFPDIVSTNEYISSSFKAEYALQSGPMLVIDRKINSKFTKGSPNLRKRSGVGLIGGIDRIVFIMTEGPVNFYDFALVFKEVFNCQEALFLDGTVSSMYCPDLDLRNPHFGNYGSIIGVTQKDY